MVELVVRRHPGRANFYPDHAFIFCGAATDLASAAKHGDCTDFGVIQPYYCLIFLLEKVEIGKVKDATEREHYAKMQSIMALVKEWFLNHGLNNDGAESDGTETLGKPFRTEWEYQIYGNFNGLSIGFDLKDFSL